MALKKKKPITPSLRQLVIVDRTGLWKGKPVKALTRGKKKTGGRNNHGRITSNHMGGGHKQRLRLVDFKLRKFDVAATVERLEYDPNRSAFIALIKYADGELAYILAPQRLKAGDEVVSGEKVQIKLNSGELRLVPGECLATVGAVSNPDNQNIVIGKAGRQRWLGRRPVVRGVAMNPVDHPHGGGEGRTSGGRHPVTPWGKPTK